MSECQNVKNTSIIKILNNLKLNLLHVKNQNIEQSESKQSEAKSDMLHFLIWWDNRITPIKINLRYLPRVHIFY